MSAPKHTAETPQWAVPRTATGGPWQTRDDFDQEGRLTIIGNVDGEYDADGVPQCTYDTIAVCQDEFGEALPNAHANARLIAAAPDLLEAASAVEAVMAKNVYPQPDKPDSAWAKLVALRAAIAKATGADQ